MHLKPVRPNIGLVLIGIRRHRHRGDFRMVHTCSLI